MAKFRDSAADVGSISDAVVHSTNQARPKAPLAATAQVAPQLTSQITPQEASQESTPEPTLDRSIGSILAEHRGLTPEQVDRILVYHRGNGVRFGEAAVALGLVTKEDVLYALSQQFHYPYATEERKKLAPELVTLNEPFGQRAEYFRALRSQLIMRAFVDGAPRRAVAVISPDTGDGKTYCVANLAVTLAQLGGRTLLIDADMRGPRIHDVFRVSNRIGLSGILSGRADRQVVQQVTGVPSLFVLPVGTTPPNPLELVERPAFGLLVRELASKFDHVLVDTPAAIYGSDCGVIAARCGLAMVVARRNRAKVRLLRELVDSIQGSSAQLVGVVMNEH